MLYWYKNTNTDQGKEHRALDVKVEGRLHFSHVTIDSGKDVLIGEGGWVGTDALGWYGGSGPGAGAASLLAVSLGGGGGGGGGGHGGRGAEGCADFAGGGGSYGDVTAPQDYGSGGGSGGGTNASSAAGGSPSSGGPPMLTLLTETRGMPLTRGPLTSLLPEGWEVREVERGPSGVRLKWSPCLIRGTRSYLLDRAGQPAPDPTRPLSVHGSACPAGYRGSSLRNWCCRGGWGGSAGGGGVGRGVDSNSTVSSESNSTVSSVAGCDCAVVKAGAFAGGRGGGVVPICLNLALNRALIQP
jgi:hypothetical protein